MRNGKCERIHERNPSFPASFPTFCPLSSFLESFTPLRFSYVQLSLPLGLVLWALSKGLHHYPINPAIRNQRSESNPRLTRSSRASMSYKIFATGGRRLSVIRHNSLTVYLTHSPLVITPVLGMNTNIPNMYVPDSGGGGGVALTMANPSTRGILDIGYGGGNPVGTLVAPSTHHSHPHESNDPLRHEFQSFPLQSGEYGCSR